MSASVLTGAEYALTKWGGFYYLVCVHNQLRKERDVSLHDGELMQVPEDSATQKADALVDTDFTVLDVEYADTSDGRKDVQKMLVRHVDQTLGLYWTPSSWIKRVLTDWYRRYPNRELFATLTREPLSGGGFKWMLVQRTPLSEAHNSAEEARESGDQIPFGASI